MSRLSQGLILRRYSAYASVGVAIILIASKTFAYLQTDSLSVLSSLIDSAIDFVASLVILYAVRHAQKPADVDHRFGHGKAEALAAMAQAAFLLGSALFLIIESFHRIFHPVPPQQTTIGIVVMAFSIVLTLALLMFQRHVIRKTRSVAIKADNLHYSGDLLLNGAVIVALILSEYFGWQAADGVFGSCIALYLAWSAWQVGKQSLDLLMDKELPDNERMKILDMIHSHQDVRGTHDLRTRTDGTNIFIEFHLELDGLMSLNAAHNVTDIVEHNLRALYPNAEISIHQEPAGLHDERLDNRLQQGA